MEQFWKCPPSNWAGAALPMEILKCTKCCLITEAEQLRAAELIASNHTLCTWCKGYAEWPSWFDLIWAAPGVTAQGPWTFLFTMILHHFHYAGFVAVSAVPGPGEHTRLPLKNNIWAWDSFWWHAICEWEGGLLPNLASWHVPFIFSVHTLINLVLVSMDPSSLKVHTLVASLFLTVSGWVGLVEPPLPRHR